MSDAHEAMVAVAGAGGRMGRTLVSACAESELVTLGAAVEAPGHEGLGVDAGLLAGIGACGIAVSDSILDHASEFDVLVEFTTPEATVDRLHQCADLGKRAVIGTTGFDAGQKALIESLSRHIAIVLAPNMSVGVNLCFELIDLAARVLGDEVDIEIVEAHHRHKVDAPSGTAVRMGEVVADALGRDLDQCAVFAREGRTGERVPHTIGFQTVRAGDIVGEHTVMFAGVGERLEITHRASSRMNFAHGALRAAHWVHHRSPGLYDMRDVLALSPNAR